MLLRGTGNMKLLRALATFDTDFQESISFGVPSNVDTVQLVISKAYFTLHMPAGNVFYLYAFGARQPLTKPRYAALKHLRSRTRLVSIICKIYIRNFYLRN